MNNILEIHHRFNGKNGWETCFKRGTSRDKIKLWVIHGQVKLYNYQMVHQTTILVIHGQSPDHPSTLTLQKESDTLDFFKSGHMWEIARDSIPNIDDPHWPPSKIPQSFGTVYETEPVCHVKKNGKKDRWSHPHFFKLLNLLEMSLDIRLLITRPGANPTWRERSFWNTLVVQCKPLNQGQFFPLISKNIRAVWTNHSRIIHWKM